MSHQKFTVYPFKSKAFTIQAYALTITDNTLTLLDNSNKSANFYLNKNQIMCIIPEKHDIDCNKLKTFIVQTVENDTPITVNACAFLKSDSELLFYADDNKTPIANMFFNVAYVVAIYPSDFDV